VSAAGAAKPKVAEEQEAPEIKYWFSTLPPETSIAHLITLAHAHLVIEQLYEDARAANVTWMTSRGGVGMGCIGTWLWSCRRRVSWRCSECLFLSPLVRTFPPSYQVESAVRSQGQIEGQIHHVKLLKRQAYGRAGFDVLRHRVLARSA